MQDLVGECNLGTTQTSSPTMFMSLTIEETLVKYMNKNLLRTKI